MDSSTDNPFTGNGTSYEEELSIEESLPDIDSNTPVEEEDHQDGDISENDPIHDYNPTDTEDTDSQGSDTDESYSEHEIQGYKKIFAIEKGLRIGLEFSSDAAALLRGNPVLACYARFRILEMVGPFSTRVYDLGTAEVIHTFEELPLVLANQHLSWDGGLLLRPTSTLYATQDSHIGEDHTLRGRQHRLIAVRVVIGPELTTLAGFRSLVRRLLRYQPKEYEKPGHLQISHLVQLPGFQTLFRKIFHKTFWLPISQALYVAERLLQERSTKTLQLSSDNLLRSRELSVVHEPGAEDATRPDLEIVPGENWSEPADDEVQHHPFSTGYVPGSRAQSLSLDCKDILDHIFADVPEAQEPLDQDNNHVTEVDDFLGPVKPQTLELQHWKPITMCVSDNESTRLNLREVNKCLIFANKQAALAISLYEPALLRRDLQFKGMTLAHIFRCALRIKVIAELAECLDEQGLRVNRDGPMWSLLNPFYVNGGTPNAAEMALIAGQAPQFGKPRPNWDQPVHKLHNILHAARLTRFPLDLLHRDQFWEWLEQRASRY